MSTDFTTELRARYDDLFEAFWLHPFVRDLADGTLSREATEHYVGQDHQYLSGYLRCYGLGIAASPDRGWMRHFVDAAEYLLNDEQQPHQVMCAARDIDYDSVQHDRLAPSAQAYIDHLTACGHDTLGVLMFALLPCPWTYGWAARRHLAETDPAVAAQNPFHGWWEFYGSDEGVVIVDDLLARCNSLAADAGDAEKQRMARAFELSCHHEIRFWQMAYTQETWEGQGLVSTRSR